MFPNLIIVTYFQNIFGFNECFDCSSYYFVFLVGLATKMVRNYVRKSERGNVSEETMKTAVLEVKLENKSIRGVAQRYGIPRKTLGRYCSKYDGLVQPSVLDSPRSIEETVTSISEVQPSSTAPVSMSNVKSCVEFGYAKPRQVRKFFKLNYAVDKNNLSMCTLTNVAKLCSVLMDSFPFLFFFFRFLNLSKRICLSSIS